MRADTRLPPYLPYPRFLLQADLTHTAKLLYALLLDRATLSQANGWLDEGARITTPQANDDDDCWLVDFYGNPLPKEPEVRS